MFNYILGYLKKSWTASSGKRTIDGPLAQLDIYCWPCVPVDV